MQGKGTTNTGNNARRCLKFPREFAKCLDLDPDFVEDLSNIIKLFKSKELIDLDSLDLYCKRTYWKYYELYPWAQMSPSIHKLLWHGPDIARQFDVPLIHLSEDASEAMHKYYRRNIKQHARQFSRAARLKDIFRRGMYMTDPKISHILIEERLKMHKKHEMQSLKETLQKM